MLGIERLEDLGAGRMGIDSCGFDASEGVVGKFKMEMVWVRMFGSRVEIRVKSG